MVVHSGIPRVSHGSGQSLGLMYSGWTSCERNPAGIGLSTAARNVGPASSSPRHDFVSVGMPKEHAVLPEHANTIPELVSFGHLLQDV